jgi:hypothetical protein
MQEVKTNTQPQLFKPYFTFYFENNNLIFKNLILE